jgi:ABC-type sugar transport system ATPase subunit
MLEARGIRKAYGGVVALHGVDLTVHAGSAHALLGENGAGKSTLVKILGGAVRPDEGAITLDGRDVRYSTTAEAVAAGVAVVSQELNLFPDLDVLANLFPMREPHHRGPFVDREAMAREAEPVLRELGLDVSPRRRVGSLTLAERQLLEIARALITGPRVLILDEPTSALEAAGVDRLMHALEVLRARNVAVVYVTHVLEEVMSLCDEVTVLRDGATVLSAVPRAQLTVPAIVDAMLGERGRDQKAVADAGETVPERLRGTLELRDVTVPGRLEHVSLAVESGEVVGVAGLAGSGHLTVLEVVFGLRKPSSGEVIACDGKRIRSQREALVRGVALVSGDRHRVGLMLDKPLWENIGQVRAVALRRAGRLIRRRELRERAQRHVERLHVRTRSVDATAGRLSGGNQQKVVFAKWLELQPTVLLLDDPTRGVDVGTKAEMHDLIRAEAASGAAVVLASTDIDELVAVCDRVVVFFQGKAFATLEGDALAQHTIIEAVNTGTVSA